MRRTLDVLIFRSSCGNWTVLANISTSDLFPQLLGRLSAERSPQSSLRIAYAEEHHLGYECLRTAHIKWLISLGVQRFCSLLEWTEPSQPQSSPWDQGPVTTAFVAQPPLPSPPSFSAPLDIMPESTLCKYPAQKYWAQQALEALISQISLGDWI